MTNLIPRKPSMLARQRGAAATPPPTCSGVDSDNLCLPCGLARLEPSPLLPGLQRRRVKRREWLYREGESLRNVYAVRAGSFKSVMLASVGEEHVTGFQVGGDVLGVDGLARQRYESTAIALEDSEVLVLPYGAGAPRSEFTAELHHLVAKLLSREIVRERQRTQLMAHRSAETRVATFLLDLSQRMQARGYSGTEFQLRMTREEIGSYLGLQIETVSRALGALHDKRLVEAQGRRVRLVDLPALATVTREVR